MKRSWISMSTIVALVLGVLTVQTAVARNFHISGGIQYVVQGDKEKAKGNLSDAERIYGKAVKQLLEGIEDSPKDVEAWDYLGRAYANLDSADKAGWAFAEGIRLTKDDADKKKVLKRMLDNRQHYWANYYTAAIEIYTRSEGIEDETAARDTAILAAEAMRKAIALWREDPRGYCNLAVFYVQSKQLVEAMEVVEDGLTQAPEDSCLSDRKHNITIAMANQSIETGDHDAAIVVLEGVMEKDPEDEATAYQLGQLYFQQGNAVEDVAKKKESFTNSAKYFGVYHSNHTDDPDAAHNYALALNSSGQYEEAAGLVHSWLVKMPENPDVHGLMATSYRGMSINDVAVAHQLTARVLEEGTKVEDPAAHAIEYSETAKKTYGAKADADDFLAERGSPDEIRTLLTGKVTTESWFWWGKAQVVTFHDGRKVTELDFSKLAVAKGSTDSASSTP